MFKTLRIRMKISLSVGLLMILIFSTYTVFTVTKAKDIAITSAQKLAVELAGKYGNQVKNSIEKALYASHAGAETFKAMAAKPGSVDRSVANAMIIGLTEADSSFYGTQVVFEPNALDGRDAEYIGASPYGPKGEYGPYYWRENGKYKVEDLIQHDPGKTRAWYMNPRDTKKPILTEPYYSKVAGTNMATVSVPMLRDGKFLGIVGIDFVLGEFQHMVEDIKPMGSGYAFLASNKGYCVANPNKDLVGKNIAEAFPEAVRSQISEAIKSGKPFRGEMVSPETKVQYLYQFEPIYISGTSTPWTIGVAIPTDKIYAEANDFFFLSMVISIAAIIVMLAVVMFIARSISKPIDLMCKTAKSISKGNYENLPGSENYGGELLDLHNDLKGMVDALVENIGVAEEKSQEAKRQTDAANKAAQEASLAKDEAQNAKREGMLLAAGELEGVVEIATSASGELSAQIEHSSRGSEEQSSRVSETATAMEEMNATVLEVAKNASQAAESTAQARDKAQDGAGIVGQVVTGISEVQKQAIALKEDMSALGKQSEAIGQIMNVISDIADQTNLLALNAAIEAARAGEAGRGFAVVADEVRKLAEKTMTATKEVGDAIQGIQNGTRKNIDSVDSTAKMIEEATVLAKKSGDTLSEIVQMVDSAADQVRSIATASEEQSAASEEISRSIEQVASISSETAQAMGEAALAVAELSRQTQVLQNLIVTMKAEAVDAATSGSAIGGYTKRALS